MFGYCVEFFEDCIAEEQFEAQKLDIMRDAVRAKAEYTIIAKSDEELLKPQLSPPALPKPDEGVLVNGSESVVNGTDKSEVEKGKEEVTINQEGTTFCSDEEMANSQEIITQALMENGTEADHPVPTNGSSDLPQPISQDPSILDVSTDAAQSNSTS